MEYSFDNSMLNSYNSKRINFINSHDVSGRDSLYRLSLFSKSQSFQNFIKKKTENNENEENIYVKKADTKNNTQTRECTNNSNATRTKYRLSLDEEEQRNIKNSRHNIYKGLHQEIQKIIKVDPTKMKKKRNLDINIDHTKKMISTLKNGAFRKKNVGVVTQNTKLQLPMNKYSNKGNKFVNLSTTNKSSRLKELFNKRNSGAELTEYSKHKFKTLNDLKNVERQRNENKIISMKDLSKNKYSPKAIPKNNTTRLPSNPAIKRTLSTNKLINNKNKSTTGLLTMSKPFLKNTYDARANSKVKIALADSESLSSKAKPTSRINIAKTHTEKSKEKFEKSLKKMEKYKLLKQNYNSKANGSRRSISKHCKTFSNASLPKNNIFKTQHNGSNFVENSEYKDESISSFDNNSSNNTTGKSIDQFEGLVKRIYNKFKR